MIPRGRWQDQGGAARSRVFARDDCYKPPVTDQPLNEAYFNEIEAHFVLRRGTPFPILGTKDSELIKKWLADGIPLPIVFEAIDAVFEKNETSGRKKAIFGLTYCRHAVKELWKDRQNLYVGSGEVTPEASARTWAANGFATSEVSSCAASASSKASGAVSGVTSPEPT